MQLKFEWIESRRLQISKENAQCDIQTKELIETLLKDVKEKEQQLIHLREQVKIKNYEHQQQFLKVATRAKTLETVITAKQQQIDRIKQQLAGKTRTIDDKNEQIQSMMNKILQLQHSLKVNQDSYLLESTAIKKQLQDKQNQNCQQMMKLVKKHEAQLTQLQQKLNKMYTESLTELKKANLQLLQKIQLDSQIASTKQMDISKKNQSQYSRITNENVKLIGSINELKVKVLNLQTSLNASQQQAKIAVKEGELAKQNYRREIQLLKDEKTGLKQKNRKLNQRIDELTWNIKQIRLTRDEEIKQVQIEVDRSFKDILEKAEEQTNKILKENEHLKHALSQKQVSLVELQKMSMRIKEMFEDQQKQFLKVKDENEVYRKQVSSGGLQKINEQLKAEVVRKNCELQVMQDQIKRLKSKINNIIGVQQQFNKFKQLMAKQNKMLLSEIVFLRQKEKKGKKQNSVNLSGSNVLSELNSEQSRVCQDIEEYKKIIQFMTDEMNEASKKIIEKDMRIEKLEAQVKRYERELQLR